MVRFATEGALRPVIRKLITQVRSIVPVRISLVPTPIVATPRQRQKRRIDPSVPSYELPRTVDQRTVPAKMRKRWIHQTMQEATPRPTPVDETSGTEEEHMDINLGNSTLLFTFCASAH